VIASDPRPVERAKRLDAGAVEHARRRHPAWNDGEPERGGGVVERLVRRDVRPEARVAITDDRDPERAHAGSVTKGYVRSAP
jgi:hypothetical protein